MKDTNLRKIDARRMRFETLENREMLDASSILAPPPNATDTTLVDDVNAADLDSIDVSRIANAPAEASTHVNTVADVVDPDDGLVSLREAVTIYAKVGQRVTFDDALAGQTITLVGGELTIDKTLTIDATNLLNDNGTSGVVIDANSASRVVAVTNGAPTLKGLTLANGRVDADGAGIYLAQGTGLSLVNSVVKDCVVNGGGGAGIYANGAKIVTIVDSAIANNLNLGESDADAGAGIYMKGGVLQMTNVNLLNNSGANGAGIYANGANILANGGSIVGNNAAGDGGGALVVDGTVSFANIAFDQNSASLSGGGICFNNVFSAAMTNCAITNNTSAAGGGIALINGASVIAANSLVAKNNAEIGGGIYLDDADALMTNFTIANNDAVYPTTAGIYVVNGGAVAVNNSILATNGVVDLAVDKTSTAAGRNVLAGTTSNDAWTSLDYVFEYIDGAPLFVDMERGNYSLDQNSLARDNGANDYVGENQLDLDGNQRIRGANVDLGAYEACGIRIESYNPSTKVMTFSWDPIEGAQSYKLRISRNGGASWVNIASNVVELEKTIGGIAVGQAYEFKVYGSAESGGVLYDSAYQRSFKPFTLQAETDVVAVGETLAPTIVGADGASGYYRWYKVINGKDVEIVEARGLEEYTPTEFGYAIRAVVVGTGYSAGSSASILFSPTIQFEYDPTTRSALLTWPKDPNAEKYIVKISRNNGETWLTYRKDVQTTSTKVNGLYVGKTYSFRVYSVVNGKMTKTYTEGSFSPQSVGAPLELAFVNYLDEF